MTALARFDIPDKDAQGYSRRQEYFPLECRQKELVMKKQEN
jgi:hypothetical protein